MRDDKLLHCGHPFRSKSLNFNTDRPFFAKRRLTPSLPAPMFARLGGLDRRKDGVMKVLNSLKSAKTRDKNCRVVRRKGRIYVINKRNPRFKARQG